MKFYQGHLQKVLFLIFITICMSAGSLLGQKVNESYRYHIQKTDFPVVIDGRMEEPGWQNAQNATDFFMITPMDTTYANLKTEVRLTYDSDNIYLFVVNYLSADFQGEYVVESLRRDFNFGRNDNFLLAMDTYDDQTNGFSFGANAAGAEWDGMMSDGGSMNLNWDNKWESAVVQYDDRWTFEAAIPFKSIRYDRENLQWGINFSRYDLSTFEKSGWAPVPRQFPSVSLAFTGYLIWDEPPPSAGSNISIIPHLLGGVNHDFQIDDSRSYTRDAGVNAKIGLGSSLNLDLTVNPDFSQVEVDEQIIDLDRFEIFFPERRQFFLENEDLFASFGNRNVRPFFSRRIGLDAPIQAGGRLSGQINKNWRLGVMNMQTGSVENSSTPSQNYTVLALKRRVSARSNIGFLLVNRENTGDLENPAASAFDRNVGFEANLATDDDLWQSKITLLKSFSPNNNNRSLSHVGSLNYNDGNFEFEWEQEYVGEDYTADVGFVPRRGYIRTNPDMLYLFFPDSDGSVLSHGPGFQNTVYFSETLDVTDYENRLSYRFNFRDGSNVEGYATNTFVELFRPFDPTGISNEFLDIGSEHRWFSGGIEYNSRAQRLLTYSLGTQYGGFYADGSRLLVMSQLGYRFQPYVNLSLSVNYNYLDLPEPWGVNDFWLIGTRFDVTFTKNLYLTSFTQYNEQRDNVNINTRLQWRFQPASDLFIVYTDNYLPNNFNVKNRAILLKLTYWWNI
jgi:hypothetical protein